MPRGKRNVYVMLCGNPRKDAKRFKPMGEVSADEKCNMRVGTIRLHNKNWREFSTQKFCPRCGMRTEMKLKQERHSS